MVGKADLVLHLDNKALHLGLTSPQRLRQLAVGTRVHFGGVAEQTVSRPALVKALTVASDTQFEQDRESALRKASADWDASEWWLEWVGTPGVAIAVALTTGELAVVELS